MRRGCYGAAVIAIALAGCRSEDKPAPAPTPKPTPTPPVATVSIDRDALLAGKLPDGAPEVELINAQCRVCHSTEYLTQQRLAEPAWKKTIEKMRKFGANVSDEQVASLAAFAARYWNPELPGRSWTPGPPPPGALPIATQPAK
ncbi:MAG TPA: cytochrome c [Kofleriaceae bacterium]